MSQWRSLTTRPRLSITESIRPCRPFSSDWRFLLHANAAYRQAALYAACQDGVRCCQGSQRVFPAFFTGRHFSLAGPGGFSSVESDGLFFSTGARSVSIAVVSPAKAAIMLIALLTGGRTLLA